MRVDVMDVRNHKSIISRIDQGIKWIYNSIEAQKLSDSIIEELKELAKII